MCKTYQHFAVFRFLFGSYLFYHFYELLPYAKELFTSYGMISNPNLIPTWKIFPSLEVIDSNIEIFIYVSMISSVCLSFGILQQLSAAILWYIWAYLINRNIFMSNPGIPYIGILLLSCAILPNSRHLWDTTNVKNIFWIIWFLTMTGYTISGIHKLQCQSWLDGTALIHIINSPLARNTYILTLVKSMPIGWIKLGTWIALVLEITSLPVGTFYYTRPFYWIALVLMHLGVLLLVNFTDLTFGMLIVHLFIFDTDWIQ